MFPARYKLKDLGDVTQGKASLDPFHTHFVLVDNGTEGRPGVEINMRVALEKYIAAKCMCQYSNL